MEHGIKLKIEELEKQRSILCDECESLEQELRQPLDDYENDAIPYEINGREVGVSFKAWISTNPNAYENIFWERNFYPSLEVLAQDLYDRGLIPEGEYTINIDW